MGAAATKGAILTDRPAHDAPPEARETRPADLDDFSAWITPHLPRLRAVARRLVGRDEADDLVQETCVRAWRASARFDRDRGGAQAWLVTILVNEARRRRRRSVFRLINDDRWDHGPDALARLDVEEVVRTLPRRQREVVVLHYLADLGVIEVAAVLGISVGTVKSHLSAARAALRAELGER